MATERLMSAPRFFFPFYWLVWFGVPPQFGRYKTAVGLRGLLANLGEPRTSARLSVDSAFTRSQELRQIRGAHRPLREAL